ncbi:HNH endonuclease family protein [Nocardiopsis coralliicola]
MPRRTARPAPAAGPHPRSRRPRTVRGAVAAVLAALLLLAAGYAAERLGLIGGPGGEQGPGSGAAAAREALDGLPVQPAQERGDYDRDAFGSGWTETDGCSTRHTVLARDLDAVQTEGSCTVVAGELDDPYTGTQIAFTADDPQAVQIDHIVPLSLAWRSGAADWERDRRVEFANDPGNLAAVDGPANSAKGDDGPAEWQPAPDGRCDYAVAYIDVSDRYALTVAPEDAEALEAMLDSC